MPTLPRVGDELAGYRLRGVLGRGGMSVVYEAENPRLGSTVALKVLAPELATNDLFRARFLRESRIAASLNHPNVIPIYDMGAHEDLLFIAMRYVVGSDLRAVLKANRVLTPDQTLLLISQAGRALDAAHRHGLVHRDVKPGNILIEQGSDDESEPDHVYLSDFGLSKHAASRSGLTATGEFMGTVDYISPEQIKARPVDGRADIYSLGCVLYECLTGRVPFSKDINAAVIWAHVEEMPTAPSSVQPTLPPSIDHALAKALAKDPADRYATCRELVAAVRAALPGAASAVPHAATVLSSRPAAAEPFGSSLSGSAAGSAGPSLSAPAAAAASAASAASAAAAAPERDATSAVSRAVSEETTPGSPPVYPRPASHSLTNQAPSVPSSVPSSAGPPPAGLSPAGPPPAGPPPAARSRQWRILAVVTGLVVVIAAVGGWLIGHNSNHGTNSTSGTSTSSSPAPTQQASAPAPPAPGSWAMGRDAPFRVQQLEAAVLDNRIWLAGGLLGPDAATNKTEYYDPTLRTWGAGPSLPFLVHHAALVNYQGKLWLIGGFLPVGHNLEASASDHVLFLDPAKNQWVEGPPLHHARAASAAVVIGDQIVVVGGRTGGKTETNVKQTEIFNGKSWRDAPDIPVPGDHLAGVTDGTYLYAIGGRVLSPSDNHAALQRFNPATGQWTQLTPMPAADSDFGAAYLNGQLIIFGGETLFSVLKTARSYNLATRKWSTLESLPVARHGMGVAVLGKTIYAMDGAAEPGHDGSTSTMEKLRFTK